MRVWFSLGCRAPLGKVLGDVLAACERSPLLVPQKVRLNSRQHREDLTVEEVLNFAEQMSSDVCSLTVAAGELMVQWLYGPTSPALGHSALGMSGDLTLAGKDIPALLTDLKRLCVVTRTVYGSCDIEAVWFKRVGQQEIFGSPDAVAALRALYWFNYFGAEYRAHLPLTSEVRDLALAVEELEDGGLVVVTRKSPADAVDEERLRRLAREWPFFRAYDPEAAFRPAVRIDYSRVWSLPAPERPEPQPARTFVGPPDEFIAAAADHARRFHEWLRDKGLDLPRSERDFIDVLQQHEPVIRDELLVPAIAAYGELVRRTTGGAWRKSLLHRGEPVVAKPGRPWSARRVILEVLEGLEPIDV